MLLLPQSERQTLQVCSLTTTPKVTLSISQPGSQPGSQAASHQGYCSRYSRDSLKSAQVGVSVFNVILSDSTHKLDLPKGLLLDGHS